MQNIFSFFAQIEFFLILAIISYLDQYHHRYLWQFDVHVYRPKRIAIEKDKHARLVDLQRHLIFVILLWLRHNEGLTLPDLKLIPVKNAVYRNNRVKMEMEMENDRQTDTMSGSRVKVVGAILVCIYY